MSKRIKYEVVDQDGMNVAGGEYFGTITECETWITEYGTVEEQDTLEIRETKETENEQH